MKILRFNEAKEAAGKKLFDELTEIGGKIKLLQREYDKKLKEIHKYKEKTDKKD